MVSLGCRSLAGKLEPSRGPASCCTGKMHPSITEIDHSRPMPVSVAISCPILLVVDEAEKLTAALSFLQAMSGIDALYLGLASGSAPGPPLDAGTIAKGLEPPWQQAPGGPAAVVPAESCCTKPDGRVAFAASGLERYRHEPVVGRFSGETGTRQGLAGADGVLWTNRFVPLESQGTVTAADAETVTVAFPSGDTRCFMANCVQPAKSRRRSASPA